jgi:hypothetical protein
MSWYPQMPVLGFEDFEGHAEELAPIAVRWADGTPIATMGILGDPSQWREQTEAQPEVEQAEQEEQRILFDNVIFLDDFRR